MEKFVGYFIGVAIAMAIALGIGWLKGGAELTKTMSVFFAGWIVGAISMYIKAMIVYKP